MSALGPSLKAPAHVFFPFQGTGSIQFGGLPVPAFPGECFRFLIEAGLLVQPTDE